MSYEYDYEYEPQERDELADKLRELVQEEINKGIAEKLADYKWLQKERSRMSDELSSARMQIRKLENDKSKFMIEHTKEVQRELFGGYTVGDVVYYAKAHKVGEVHCSTCMGTRKVDMTLGDRTFPTSCPDCANNYYQRTVYEYKPQKDKVSQINTKMWAGGEKRELEVWIDRKDGPIGGDKTFRTIEECQAYCEKLNEEEQKRMQGLAQNVRT